MLLKTLVMTAFLLALQQPSLDIMGPETLIQLGMQGSLGGVVVWIWYKTFKQSNEEQRLLREEMRQMHQATMQRTREIAQNEAEKHAATRRDMIDMLREGHTINRELVGTLNRLETKLDKLP